MSNTSSCELSLWSGSARLSGTQLNVRVHCLADQYFWRVIDNAGMAMGFTSLFAKTKLPALLMVAVGHVCAAIGWVLGRKLRVNPFTVGKTR